MLKLLSNFNHKRWATNYQQLYSNKETAVKVAFQIISMVKDNNGKPQIIFNYATDEKEELPKEAMVSNIANDKYNNDEYSVIMFADDKLDTIIKITPLVVH